ncbi:FYVE zinc finger-domain-containing protein [Tirmania nivea]|nr:FYVE zinc finger-domain-containing protein [Tirmania nivea]
MDGSSSNSRSQNPSHPSPPTLYQVPPVPGRQSHCRSLLQDHPLGPGSSSALPPIPPPLSTASPPRYHQLYNQPGVYYTPPFIPGLDPLANPSQQQSRIAHGQFSHLPEWQPDYLVRNCPICGSPFTLFFRRHHCRKCGRVVCAQCSPNRLTLASSAVVRPPGEVPPTQGLDSLGLPSSAHWGGLLGGSIYAPPGNFDWRANDDPPLGMEDVRVCCDCFAGSGPEQHDNRSFSGNITPIRRTWNGSGSPIRTSASELWTPAGVNAPDTNGRRRRQSVQGGRSLPYHYDPSTPSRQNSTSYIPQSPASGSNFTLPPPVPTPQSHSQHHNPAYSLPPQLRAKYASHPTTRERTPGLSGPSPQYGQSSTHMLQSNASQNNAPQPVQPYSQPRSLTGSGQAKLKETDYCPICTLPLPPPHPESGDESVREAHIQDCIRSHEASSSPHSRSNNPSAAASPTDTRDPLGSTPGGMNMIDFLRQSGVALAKASGRMVVYKAREEDTWDYSSEDGKGDTRNKVSSTNIIVIDLTGDDEESTATTAPAPPSTKGKCRKKAECVICFEEFEVGDLIARLECLCRYHKSCIREWFDRKGNGDCPVHAVRE